tara:strand:+ start:424 stop:828 length:405 start_codon:yes stop_codon:yes gene_type:complete
MNEYEIWSLNNSGLIGNAMYIAGIVFLLWVALRAANQVRTENSNVSVKILVSLFSLGIIYNGLFTGAVLINTVEGTAYLLSQLDSINAFSQSFVDAFNTGNPEAGINIFTSNPINTAWWAVITLMIFGRIWTKN